MHIPVLLEELTGFLNLKQGMVILDATIGEGGHAERILEKTGPDGLLIGIDKDEQALKLAAQKLAGFGGRALLFHDDFKNAVRILDEIGRTDIDGAFFDLGVSSLQLDEARRGFSIKYEGPLDMRMDQACGFTAEDIVNREPLDELERILREFGEERFFRRIARAIVEKRRLAPIKTTAQLKELIERTVPRTGRLHPATKTFQALRIAVNGELDVIDPAIRGVIGRLRRGARVCVISFHSLEDRIVKNLFRSLKEEGVVQIITKKVVIASDEERMANARARSAKLRVAERL